MNNSERFCCFESTKDASVVAGVYTLFTSLLSFIYLATTYAPYTSYEHPDVILRSNISYEILFLLVELTAFIFSLIMLHALNKDNQILMLPWIIWMILETSLKIFLMVILLHTSLPGRIELGVSITLGGLSFLLGFHIISISIVILHYRRLNKKLKAKQLETSIYTIA
ncbi:uncharacterized protein [Centruroides vittatus]|uniref:uncharacterized protein n=1 Tax=Centruroides vittatus TaxID=120091 RepID=UPI00350F682C